MDNKGSRGGGPGSSNATKSSSNTSGSGNGSGSQQEREKGGITLQIQPCSPPCSLPIVLGSSSSHRRAVMERLGWDFSTASPDIDEKAIRDPDPRKMCAEIARAKARSLVQNLNKPGILITADQVCLFQEEVREKPENAQEAMSFLASYSGQSVKTLSALCVTNLETGRVTEGMHEATVFWKHIPTSVVDGVVARGLVMSSAGGFALEDPDLGSLVHRIEGSVDNIFGLPVDLLCTLVTRAAV
eukprot:g14882.t1